MRIYAERFLPWIMEKALNRPVFRDQRRSALLPARGRVLEVGFGFGASLDAYPAAGIVAITALDPNPGMQRRARRPLARSPLPVRSVRGFAEALPFPSAVFDTVVSNWTLCSLRLLPESLSEIRRVLAPGGTFLFLEHGLAASPRLARVQRFLTPLQRLIAGGCRLDVDIEAAIRSAGFRIEALERYQSAWVPRVLAQMCRGLARPS